MWAREGLILLCRRGVRHWAEALTGSERQAALIVDENKIIKIKPSKMDNLIDDLFDEIGSPLL
jgi:hypothetical protein